MDGGIEAYRGVQAPVAPRHKKMSSCGTGSGSNPICAVVELAASKGILHHPPPRSDHGGRGFLVFSIEVSEQMPGENLVIINSDDGLIGKLGRNRKELVEASAIFLNP